jgi:type II secretory pathway pseudopilin PulG
MEKYQKLIHKKGQGLVEVLVSVGIIVLILAGVVPMMLTSMASKTKTFERKKAIELAEVKMEELVNMEKNDGTTFWETQINNPETDKDASSEGFLGYTYSTSYTFDTTSTNCTELDKNCVNVNIEVEWIKDPTKKVSFSRFFARN